MVSTRIDNGAATPAAHSTAHAEEAAAHADPNDINPRSPKRRRLSPPGDDGLFDIGAAAARALALSLGNDIPDVNGTSKSEHGSNPPTSAPARASPLINHSQRICLENLPALNELAQQVLHFLAQLNHLEIGEMLFGPPSQRGHDYRALKRKFDEAKKIYIIGSSPFVSPHALNIYGSNETEMVRRVNLAIFMASIFSGEIGLRVMDMNFLDVFVPDGGRLLKAQGSIYLELKTHAFMAATRTASTMLSQVMTDLFPTDMDKALLQKRPDAKSLAPSEQDFVNRLGSRRDILYSMIRSNKLSTLPDTYRWNDFAREVSMYLTKHMEVGTGATKDGLDAAAPQGNGTQLPQDHMENSFSIHPAAPAAPGSPSQQGHNASKLGTGFDPSFDIEAMVAQAARAAALSMGNGIDMTLLPVASNLQPNAASPEKLAAVLPGQANRPNPRETSAMADRTDGDPKFQHYEPGLSNIELHTSLAADEPGEIPHSSQTAPTQVLYERARQVTTNKVLNSKKMAPPTHRRPWTTEEENALMTGLDQVKGPHWSQILAMYGPGGTMNESLKDRNQVQLKDKARNLKLFFLKAGIEVPYYLQAVTGDLRTRAPGQAEKMERERLQGEGERGLQDDVTGSVEMSEAAEIDLIDSIESTPNSHHISDEQTAKGRTTPVANVKADFDIEAIIAQAAASATQGIGPPPP